MKYRCEKCGVEIDQPSLFHSELCEWCYEEMKAEARQMTEGEVTGDERDEE